MYVTNIIELVIFFAILIICSYTDIKKGKIYNKYILMALLLFVFVNIINCLIFQLKNVSLNLVINELNDNFYGFLIGFLIGFVFYLMGVFKGGDAKLFAVVGLYVGKKQLITHYSYIMIVAGVGALFILIKNKILLKRLHRVFLYIKGLVLSRSFNKYVSEDDNIKFPFAVYVLIGEVFAYLNYFLRG